MGPRGAHTSPQLWAFPQGAQGSGKLSKGALALRLGRRCLHSPVFRLPVGASPGSHRQLLPHTLPPLMGSKENPIRQSCHCPSKSNGSHQINTHNLASLHLHRASAFRSVSTAFSIGAGPAAVRTFSWGVLFSSQTLSLPRKLERASRKPLKAAPLRAC